MAIVSIPELKPLLAPGSRLLGLDLGEKTIGLALSDTLLTVATPMETLKRGKFTDDAAIIDEIVREHGVGGLVIGLPLSLEGKEGPAAQSARAFARNVAKRSDIPMALVDERFSTAAVTRTLLEADASRKRRAEVVDKLAAAYILQGALDAMRTSKP
jgi:putative pre-16S rRNA nuclease